MKLNLKDEPKEWRKSALLAAGGLALLSSLLRWRHALSPKTWWLILAALAAIAVLAIARPRWFRGYHLLSMRLGFAISRLLGQVVLTIVFFLIIVPLGLILRLLGKDALQLKPARDAKTYWQPVKERSPLDRMF